MYIIKIWLQKVLTRHDILYAELTGKWITFSVYLLSVTLCQISSTTLREEAYCRCILVDSKVISTQPVYLLYIQEVLPRYSEEIYCGCILVKSKVIVGNIRYGSGFHEGRIHFFMRVGSGSTKSQQRSTIFSTFLFYF